jgi:hypothetical protein
MITLPQGDLLKDSGILQTAAQHNGVNVGIYASVINGGRNRRGDRSCSPELGLTAALARPVSGGSPVHGGLPRDQSPARLAFDLAKLGD